MAKTNEELAEKYLPKRKVILKPVPRDSGMITDKAHVAYFMYDGAIVSYVLPKSRSTGRLVSPFESEEEQAFFEKKFGLKEGDMNIHREKDNYFHTFNVKVRKDAKLMFDGMELDLSDAYDALKYRILKLQPEVAPSWEERTSKGDYRFALVDEDYEYDVEVKRSSLIAKAYKHYGKIEESRDKMYEFLYIYWLSNPKAEKPTKDAKITWYQKELSKIIDTNIKGYLEIVEDTNYKEKVLIHKALEKGIIKINKKTFELPDGTSLGESIKEVLAYYADGRHQEDKLKLEAQIENS